MSCLLPLFLNYFLLEYSCSPGDLVQFSHTVVSDSLQPQGLQHARLPCPSPTPGACSNSCPSSGWCHPAISSSVIHFSSRIRVFSSESTLHMRGPKYWSFSFSISPSNEYSGLIYFRMDWFDLLAIQGTSQYVEGYIPNYWWSLSSYIETGHCKGIALF